MSKGKVNRKRGVLLHLMVTDEISNKLKEMAEEQGRSVTELARESFAKLTIEYDVLKNKKIRNGGGKEDGKQDAL